MDSTIQLVSILVIVIALVLTVVMTQFVRVRRSLTTLRTIPAYEMLPGLAALAIESGRPLHLSSGSSSLGGETTLLTLASTELFYQVTQRAAIGDVPPIISVSSASVLPVGQDIIRRAYRQRGRLQAYRYSSVRWYPSGSRSLAFAAALTALMGDDRVSANLLAGGFGTELALIMEAGLRRDLPSLAVTTDLEGQAIAYAFATQPLIGEEIFVAGAYLGADSAQLGATVALDVLRWLLIAALFGTLIAALRNGA